MLIPIIIKLFDKIINSRKRSFQHFFRLPKLDWYAWRERVQNLSLDLRSASICYGETWRSIPSALCLLMIKLCEGKWSISYYLSAFHRSREMQVTPLQMANLAQFSQTKIYYKPSFCQKHQWDKNIFLEEYFKKRIEVESMAKHFELIQEAMAGSTLWYLPPSDNEDLVIAGKNRNCTKSAWWRSLRIYRFPR